ncbi:MAG: 50S ribosomal protein L9 [Firmicutes bacterium]|nr:50S ribosomal protein L9 [Bacillota bacterium]MDY5531385.1 50S ribosomal protein L9 [Pumilibacteraceae bacterium]
MKVILLKDVKGQGKKNDVIEVSDGYGRNFLIKNGLATVATSTQVNSINISKAAEEKRKAAEKAEAIKLAKELETKTVVVEIKTGETGKLFGALNTQAISDALKKQGVELDKKKIVLSDPIKSVGEYTITVKPYAEVSAKLKVIVKAAE